MSTDKTACNHSFKSDVISPAAFIPLLHKEIFFKVSQLICGIDSLQIPQHKYHFLAIEKQPESQ